ncbi:MAG: hypothetical protein JSW48_15250 [Betaproteobacteria bacterium]|jgi:hypothetical protein|nr:MAG: hypothetical protein JSW48_15250 [Betaproteobacteria bacterium]
MLKTLKGMEWSEAAPNVASPPLGMGAGSIHYYEQKGPEIRRKIILRAKATPCSSRVLILTTLSDIGRTRMQAAIVLTFRKNLIDCCWLILSPHRQQEIGCALPILFSCHFVVIRV